MSHETALLLPQKFTNVKTIFKLGFLLVAAKNFGASQKKSSHISTKGCLTVDQSFKKSQSELVSPQVAQLGLIF